MDFIFAGPGPASSMLMPAERSSAVVKILIDGFIASSSWLWDSRHWRPVKMTAISDRTIAVTDRAVEVVIAPRTIALFMGDCKCDVLPHGITAPQAGSP